MYGLCEIQSEQLYDNFPKTVESFRRMRQTLLIWAAEILDHNQEPINTY